MSYIGSTPTTQNFIAGTDSFNGTGSATNFTLSRFVNSTNDIQVVVNNVVQYPPNYSVSGNTLTISPAPSAGTNNVYVRYLSTTLQSVAPVSGITQQFASGTVANPSITFLGDPNTGIYSPAADTIAFSEGGVEAMRINSSANVGIGSPDPRQRFTAANASITGGAPASSGNAADPNAVSRFQAGSIAMDFGVYPAGQMWIQNRAASNYALNYDLVLQPNGGNVGIGTSSPNQRLQVNNPAAASSLALFTNATTGSTNADGSFYGVDSSGNAYVWNQENLPILFGTNNGERMRIDSSGRLGFPGAQSTYGAVTVYGTKNGWGGINFNSTAGTNIGTLMIADGIGGFFNSADNAWLGYFWAGGVVFSNGATFVTPVGTAPSYGCRAWVNFNGTGTVAIRASGNVSSITDNGTGNYTANFTTAMSDANYSYQLATSEQTGAAGDNGINATSPSAVLAGSIRVVVRQSSTAYDSESVSIAIFR
jgi:hypothetical protein